MLKQFKDAEEFYMESLTKAKEESQSQDPIIFMNLRGLGDILILNNQESFLRAKGEFQKSINFYDQALALRITLYHYLEKLKVQKQQITVNVIRGLGKYEDSIIYYKKSLEINKNDLISLSGLGESLNYQNKYNYFTNFKELFRSLELL